MMRVHAGRAPQCAGGCVGERRRGARALQVGAGDDLAQHARSSCPGDDLAPIVLETGVRQIRSDVDELGCAGRRGSQEQPPGCDIFIRMIRIRMFRVASLVLIAMFAAAPAQAQEGGDLQAQILYAFHTEDTHQLGNLVQSLTTQVKAGGASASLHYHLAHALYRYGLLMGDSRSGNSGAAFVDCIDELKPVLEEDVKSAEALILQYVCYANLAKYRR